MARVNPLLIASVCAVLVDSIVTVVVGIKLNSTAEKKIEQGVNNIIANAPAILAKAIAKEGEDGESQS